MATKQPVMWGGGSAGDSDGNGDGNNGRREKVVQSATLSEILFRSGKFSMLDRMLIKFRTSNRRVCIFTNCNDTLELLDRYCYLRGWRYVRLGDAATQPEAYAANVNSFNKDDSRHFLVLAGTNTSDRAEAGLHTADTIVLFDSNENQQMERKTIARCNKPGKDSKVFVCRLLVTGFADESLFKRGSSLMQEHGAEVAAAHTLKGDVRHLFQSIMYGSDSIAATTTVATLDDASLAELLDRTSQKCAEDDSFAEKFRLSCEARAPIAPDAANAATPTIKRGSSTASGQRHRCQPVASESLPDVLGRPSFDSEDTCLRCWLRFDDHNSHEDPRGRRLVCSECPASIHTKCADGLRVATAEKNTDIENEGGGAAAGSTAAGRVKGAAGCGIGWSCPQHRCSRCQKTKTELIAADAATIIFPCAACPLAYCSSCLPEEIRETPTRFVGTCNRMEDLGYHRPAEVCYILCSDSCEAYIAGMSR